MEAAQYLWSLLTDQYQNFTKWALFGHTLQDSDCRGHPTSIWTYHYKIETVQYLWTLLTDQHQNFTKWALFGHTLHDFDHWGHPTSIPTGIFGLSGIKYWNAYVKALIQWKNNLQKFSGLWDMDITIQNRGCSISLDPVDWSAPKLHQVGNFRKYFTGFTKTFQYVIWCPTSKGAHLLKFWC